jgi:hypothetical protein
MQTEGLSEPRTQGGGVMGGKDHDTRAFAKRRNKIDGQYAAYPIEMLESPAYRALSQAAHKVIARIAIELAHHGGNDNGALPVTVDDFIEYGMHRSSVGPAIREAEALGFIKVTERGRGGNAENRAPNKFYITFLNCRSSRAKPPTHDWRKIKAEDAERIAAEARNAKDRNAVKNGRAAWKKRKEREAEKDFPVRENSTGASTEKPYRDADSPGTENPYYRISSKTRTTSISRDVGPSGSSVNEYQGGAMEVEREPKRNKPGIRLVWTAPDHRQVAEEWDRVHSTDMARLAIAAAMDADFEPMALAA